MAFCSLLSLQFYGLQYLPCCLFSLGFFFCVCVFFFCVHVRPHHPHFYIFGSFVILSLLTFSFALILAFLLFSHDYPKTFIPLSFLTWLHFRFYSLFVLTVSRLCSLTAPLELPLPQFIAAEKWTQSPVIFTELHQPATAAFPRKTRTQRRYTSSISALLCVALS